jgi:hypothetical protein
VSPVDSRPDRRDWDLLRRSLLADGYVRVPDLLLGREVEAIQQAIRADLRAVKPAPQSWGKVDPVAAVTMPIARQTIEDQRIRRAAAGLLGTSDPVFLLHCDVHLNDLSSWHKDTGETVLTGGYFGTTVFGLAEPAVVKFAVYCEDHASDSAGLHVQPGSHRDRVVRTAEGLPVASRPGDVVCFDVRVTHRGELGSPFHSHLDRPLRAWPPLKQAVRQAELRVRRRPDRSAMFFSFGIPGDLSQRFARTNWERARSQAGRSPEVPVSVLDELQAAGLALAEL